MPSHLLHTTDVHVWYRLTASLGDADIAAAASHLSSDERARASRFVHREDRRDFTVAHAMLRQALSLYEDSAPREWVFTTEAAGKPTLAHTVPLTFNLSHTRGLVACVVARQGTVGVDVEGIVSGADYSDIARENFSAAEILQLNACSSEQRSARFIDFWTLKESYVKATGAGITGGLQHWGFDLAASEQMRFIAPDTDNDRLWTFELFAPSTETRMAVAFQSAAVASVTIVARDASAGFSMDDRSRILLPTRSSARAIR